MIKTLGIIPARYASTRFPGKPLVDIKGKSMIQRVYEQATKAGGLTDIVVATDDTRICKHVEKFGGNVVMTSTHHVSGTDRCYEAWQKTRPDCEAVVNIQGDEPFIDPAQIDALIDLLSYKEIKLASLAKKITSVEELQNQHVVKVVMDHNGKALYFSRSPIPYLRQSFGSDTGSRPDFYKHIGLYAYQTDTLSEIVKLPASMLEKSEALEQLRWLEHGYEIFLKITDKESISIDTPEDLEKLINII